TSGHDPPCDQADPGEAQGSIRGVDGEDYDITTMPGHKQSPEGGYAGATVSACVALSVKASMKQSGSTQTESDVSLKIPEYTVIAFSLIELKVKPNGKFELCLIRNNGGFEKVRSNYEMEEDGIMGLRGDFAPNSPLNLNK
ncbi:gasdermin-E-like, partial [Salmo salar]|uniref:Gasdermin-E-like n=1 Tax=Salmo salar TaxID=8030 RepID=A0ABM3EE99_SALSA